MFQASCLKGKHECDFNLTFEVVVFLNRVYDSSGVSKSSQLSLRLQGDNFPLYNIFGAFSNLNMVLLKRAKLCCTTCILELRTNGNTLFPHRGADLFNAIGVPSTNHL